MSTRQRMPGEGKIDQDFATIVGQSPKICARRRICVPEAFPARFDFEGLEE